MKWPEYAIDRFIIANANEDGSFTIAPAWTNATGGVSMWFIWSYQTEAGAIECIRSHSDKEYVSDLESVFNHPVLSAFPIAIHRGEGQWEILNKEAIDA